MSITIPCSCGKRLVFKDEFAGKRGKCPVCKETFPGKNCTIEWFDDRGVVAVTYNGKNVPRSIFSTSAQSR